MPAGEVNHGFALYLRGYRMLDIINKLVREHCHEFHDMADDLHLHPEPPHREYYAAEHLCRWLEDHGFMVERGTAGLPTAFRAVYEQGEGGVSIGLLPEYDANPNGHSCGHHLQGPVILNAVSAILAAGITDPFRLVIYGTPAEEILSGKYRMIEAGCFRDIDIALQVHAFDTTGPHNGLAGFDLNATFEKEVQGTPAGPLKPALASDAFVLTSEGIAYLRKRLPLGSRFFESLKSSGEDKSEAVYSFRCLDYRVAKEAEMSMRRILEGAALMSGTEVSIEKTLEAKDVVHVPELTGLWLQKARELAAPRIVEASPTTSSTTDFGAVSQMVPGSIIWFAAVPEGTALHSDLFEQLGRSEETHQGMVIGAEILAQTCYDLISNKGLVRTIKESHLRIMKERTA